MKYEILVFAAFFMLLGGCTVQDPPPSANARSVAGSGESSPGNSDTVKPEQSTNSSVGKDGALESIYTDLREDKCVDAEEDEEDEWSIQSCQGVGGYRLLVSEGDLRQTIDVVTPNAKKYELNMWQVVSSAFSTVGDKAEWRVLKKNGTPIPVALIVRFNVNEDPENTEKITSYLTVTKITREGVCVTDIVRPIKNANERARILADSASKKPCLGAIAPLK